jgi:hypothetical protein
MLSLNSWICESIKKIRSHGSTTPVGVILYSRNVCFIGRTAVPISCGQVVGSHHTSRDSKLLKAYCATTPFQFQQGTHGTQGSAIMVGTGLAGFHASGALTLYRKRKRVTSVILHITTSASGGMFECKLDKDKICQNLPTACDSKQAEASREKGVFHDGSRCVNICLT